MSESHEASSTVRPIGHNNIWTPAGVHWKKGLEGHSKWVLKGIENLWMPAGVQWKKAFNRINSEPIGHKSLWIPAGIHWKKAFTDIQHETYMALLDTYQIRYRSEIGQDSETWKKEWIAWGLLQKWELKLIKMGESHDTCSKSESLDSST